MIVGRQTKKHGEIQRQNMKNGRQRRTRPKKGLHFQKTEGKIQSVSNQDSKQNRDSETQHGGTKHATTPTCGS